VISNSDQIDVLKRALQRERKAKEIAEGFIENRIRDLYLDNIALKSSLLNEEEFQKDLIENLVDAFFVVDFDGAILKMNKEGKKLIGANENDTPESINQFIKNIKKKLKALFERAVSKGNKELIPYEFINRKRKKQHITIKSKILYNTQNEPYAYQAIVRDVTKEVKRKEVIKENRKVLAFEALLVEDLLKHADLLSISGELVKHVAEYLGTNDCVFYAVINNELVQMAAIDQKLDGDKNFKNKLKIKIDEGIVGSVAKSKIGIITANTSKNEKYIADDLVRLSEITVPILLDGKLVGIIDAEHPEKYFFKKVQLNALTHIAGVISIYLKNTIHELEKSKKQQELSEIQSRLAIMFSSFSDAKVIESADLRIEHVNQAFLKLFGIPQEALKDLIGMDCILVRENTKSLFVNENSFAKRIDEILAKKQVCVDEILELKDGRYLSRDYNPIINNSKIIGHVWSYKDVTLKINYDQSLEYQNSKYKRIIENMNLGLLEINNKEEILTTNDAFLKMTGYTSDELIGRKTDLYLKDKKIKLNKRLKTDEAHEIEIVTKKGDLKKWLVYHAINKNINGEDIGKIIIHFDISEFRTLQVKADKLIVDLIDSNDELSHYAHVVSHDLKTPLRNISSSIYWLREELADHLSEDAITYMETVEECILNMDQLITSTLDYSEIRTTNTEKLSDLQPTVESIIKDLNKNRENDFKITLEGTLPNLKINEVKARQIFENILVNSYKYRDKNKNSYVSIGCKEQSDSFLFSIKDNGLGIDKEHVDIVFDAYKKLNTSADSSGLGLFIVKKIITSLGGKIWLKSKLGVGTTFYFTLLK
jgi:two-component system, sporulation sensor kinase E